MKTKVHFLFLILASLSGIHQAAAQSTAFTYQGQLSAAGGPANGSYDLAFSLFGAASGGTPGAGPITNSATQVSNGLFTVTLDFGAGVFTGSNYWLDISVSPAGSNTFTELSPRQPLTPVPYAFYSPSAGAAFTASTATSATTSASASTFSSPLGGDVTGTQEATIVSSVGGQTAASVASGASAANGATSSNTVNTIINRDASGSFSAGSITLNGNLDLPATTATAGVIYSSSHTLLHSFGTANFFAGSGAGNLTMSGPYNTGIGFNAFHANTTGSNNTATGWQALGLNTTGTGNTAIGRNALGNNLTGVGNTAAGWQALNSNTTGSDNTAEGWESLFSNTAGSANTATGFAALYANTTGASNAAFGHQALYSNTSGSRNTAIGELGLWNNTVGSSNIALGYLAGSAITTGNYNIDIGSTGAAGEGRAIHLGTQGVQISALIAGIYGATASLGVPVYITPTGQLGTVTSSARFKRDIRTMDNASDVILSLRPVTFRYKAEIDPNAVPQFGLVAEEVEKVDPDLVAHDDKGQIYTVRYEAVNAMLLNEFLKQHQQVEAQNTEIETLKQNVAELTQLVKTLADRK